MNKFYKVRVRSLHPVRVDPIVTEAIAKKALKEGWKEWSGSPETPIPHRDRSLVKLQGPSLWAFMKEIKQQMTP